MIRKSIFRQALEDILRLLNNPHLNASERNTFIAWLKSPFHPSIFVVSCDLGEEINALVGVGVAAFGGLWEDFPSNGNGDLMNYYAHRKNVDVTFAEFPIGAIHGENPTVFWSWNFA